MSKKINYRHIYTDTYLLPNYLCRIMERHIGRCPIWQFPPLSPTDELSFLPLHFDNRHFLLEMFAEDANPHVDKRFKDPKSVYEYVAMIKISRPYSPKHGGIDWLVFQKDDCIGILHAFEFNRERFGYQHRRCEIGYAFIESVRGTGVPQRAVAHLVEYLLKKMDLLYVFANITVENKRSIRFLEKLQFTTETGYEADEDWTAERKNATICLERFRSPQARGRIIKYRRAATQRTKEWRAKWVDNGDGSFTLPQD